MPDTIWPDDLTAREAEQAGDALAAAEADLAEAALDKLRQLVREHLDPFLAREITFAAIDYAVHREMHAIEVMASRLRPSHKHH